jgi:hypothetical protein
MTVKNNIRFKKCYEKVRYIVDNADVRAFINLMNKKGYELTDSQYINNGLQTELEFEKYSY